MNSSDKKLDSWALATTPHDAKAKKAKANNFMSADISSLQSVFYWLSIISQSSSLFMTINQFSVVVITFVFSSLLSTWLYNICDKDKNRMSAVDILDRQRWTLNK